MRNMMSQVRNCKLSLLLGRVGVGLLFLVALTGCENDPFVNPGSTENPNWVVTVDNDMTASLTAIVKVSFTDSVGTLAGFMGDDCCGIAEYKAEAGLYWLYLSPAEGTDGNVQLRFYSPELKRIFVATETIPFRNDVILGAVADPYTPTWKVAN